MHSNGLKRLVRVPLPPFCCLAIARRQYHDAKAVLISLSPDGGPVSRQIDIKIGDANESYVMVSPEIGATLAGSPLSSDMAVEVPLLYFPKSKHFSRG